MNIAFVQGSFIHPTAAARSWPQHIVDLWCPDRRNAVWRCEALWRLSLKRLRDVTRIKNRELSDHGFILGLACLCALHRQV